MGIFTACVAIGFILSGFSTNLLPLMGPQWIIFMGGGFAFVSGLLLLIYKKRHS
jgi:hypothetical protein